MGEIEINRTVPLFPCKFDRLQKERQEKEVEEDTERLRSNEPMKYHKDIKDLREHELELELDREIREKQEQ